MYHQYSGEIPPIVLRYLECKEKAIRIITGRGNRESCRNLFKELHILPLMSQYILSLLTFVSKNREQYFANSEIHNINTRHTIVAPMDYPHHMNTAHNYLLEIVAPVVSTYWASHHV
jgi:hypothetical protein